MKQVLQNIKTGNTEIAEVPVPLPTSSSVLVKTHYSLVSAGTEKSLVDFSRQNLVGKARSRPEQVKQVLQSMKNIGVLETIQIVKDRLDESVALGYSSSGEIVDIGNQVKGFSIGDRVSCSGAGYAIHGEYASVPRNLICKIPDNVTYEHAAFTTLGSISLHGLRLSDPTLGDNLCVIGLGLVGLLAVQLAKASGCKVIGFDPDLSRCELAKTLGADHVSTDAADLKEIIVAQTNSVGCDETLITAATNSNQPIELAGDITRDKGSVVAIGAVGLNIPRKSYYEKEINFQVSRSYGPGRYDTKYEEEGNDYPIGFVRWTQNRNMQTFLNLVGGELIDIEPLITHRFSIEKAAEAYDIILNPGSHNVVGTLIEYTSTHNDSDLIHKIDFRQRSSKQTNTDRTINLGLIGAGGFARGIMIPAIKKNEDINLAAVCTANGHTSSETARKYGFKMATTSTEEIFQSPEINAVAIATQHNLHAKLVIDAINNGKPVFTEKPLCLTLDELNQITEVVESSPDSLLMVGFNRRFSKMTNRIKSFLQSIEQPVLMNYRINAGFIPLDHWTQDPARGGGRILGEICHFIDLLCFISNKIPASIYTCSLPNGGKYNDDNLLITLEFKDGSIGSITYIANSNKSLKKERLELFSGESYAILDDFRTLTINKKGKSKIYKSRLRQDKGYVEEWNSFFNCVRNGNPIPIEFKQIHASTLTTLLAARSLTSGKKELIHL